MKNFLLFVFTPIFCFLFLFVSAVSASDPVPSDAKPLSEILQSVAKSHPGVISEAEFEHGRWEIKTHHATTHTKLYVDARTAEVTSTKPTKAREVPSEGVEQVEDLVRKIENAHVGQISEVKFSHGQWEIKLHIAPSQKK